MPKVEKFNATYSDMCGNCKGEGRIWKETIRMHGYSNGSFITCPLCEGSGLVSVTKETIVTITAKKPCSKNE